MIKTYDLEKIFSLALYSAYVAREKAVSIMVISERCESGKTEVANKFYGNRGVATLSDVTAYALWRDFKRQIEDGSLKHLIIPEFLAPLSRKAETVGSFIATLQMLIEEGIMEIHTGFLKPMRLSSPTAIGAIICLPRTAFVARKTEWELSGFLSRFLVVSYSYDDQTVDAIFNSIAEREYLSDDHRIKLLFPDKPQDIEIPPDITEMAKVYVREHTERLRRSGRGYGFRELKNMLRLMCANVIFENMQTGGNREAVSEADLEEVKRLSYLINEEFNAMKGGE